MKRTIPSFSLILLAAAIATAQAPAPAPAPSAPSLYRQVAKFMPGGDGGWDYLTFDPGSNRLFVSRGKSFMVLDASDGKLLGEVPADGAHGAAIVNDKNRGFSTNGRAGTVTVFDLKTLKPISDIKVGEGPDAIVYDEFSKRVIVMHGRSKDVAVIDPDSMKVEATIPLGAKLEFAASDRGHVYVNAEDTAEIVAIDSKTWKIANRWKLEGCEEPSGLAIDRRTDRLFTVCGNKKMMVVSTKDGSVVSTVATGAGTDAAGFDPELKFAFASNGEGTLTVVRPTKDGRQYEAAENVPTQRSARTMALDAKSHRVFLAAAEFGPPAEGQRRGTLKPGSFTILVYEPAKK